MDRFEPNLRIPGPTALPPRVRERGRPADDQPPRPGVRRDARADPRRHEAVLRDDVRRRDAHDGRDPAGSRPRSSTRCRPATASWRVSIGSFGDRFAKIAGIYGADVTKLDAEWGYAAAADEVRERLRAMPDARAVLLTHNETSTGVMNPIAELAAAIREEAPGRADPGRQRVGPWRGAVRDGRRGASTSSSRARRRRGWRRRAWR